MAADWQIMRRDKQYGPFTDQQLRELVAAKKLSPNDLVWKQGMPQWVAAGTVAVLFPARESPPRSSPVSTVETDSGTAPFIQIDTGSSGTPSGGARSRVSQTRKKSTNYLPWILGGVAILILVSVGFMAMSGIGGGGGGGSTKGDKNLGSGRISVAQLKSVREGDSASDVRKKLGKPSDITTLDETTRSWTYVVVKPAVDEYAVEQYEVWGMVFDRPETTLKIKLLLGKQ